MITQPRDSDLTGVNSARMLRQPFINLTIDLPQ
jgi:hypothetical protein